jgi:hypothetical protein
MLDLTDAFGVFSRGACKHPSLGDDVDDVSVGGVR